MAEVIKISKNDKDKVLKGGVFGLWVKLSSIDGATLLRELLAAKKRSQACDGPFVEGRFMIEGDGTAYFEWQQKK